MIKPVKQQPFSEQIRAAIRKSGLSQYAIARAIDVSDPMMSRFMSGKSGMGLANLDKLAAFVRLKVELIPRKGR